MGGCLVALRMTVVVPATHVRLAIRVAGVPVASIAATGGLRRPGGGSIVKPGHQIEDVENVVEWHEAFYVVEKRAGSAAELAEELDPRG